MKAFATATLWVGLTVLLLTFQRAGADLTRQSIYAPQHCPDGLTLKSRVVSGGMLEFEVSLNAEQAVNAGAAYRGKVRPEAYLKVRLPDQQVAAVNLKGIAEGKQTRYSFRLSPSAARSSDLQLEVSLYEKDGKPAPGGVAYQVFLAGFPPIAKQDKNQP